MSFVCKTCNHELEDDYEMKTAGYCYMCDPNITLQELMSNEPIEALNKEEQ